MLFAENSRKAFSIDWICPLDYNTVEQENIPNCTCKIESDKSTYQVEIKIELN